MLPLHRVDVTFPSVELESLTGVHAIAPVDAIMPPPPLTLNPHAAIREEMNPVMPSHPLSPCGKGPG